MCIHWNGVSLVSLLLRRVQRDVDCRLCLWASQSLLDEPSVDCPALIFTYHITLWIGKSNYVLPEIFTVKNISWLDNETELNTWNFFTIHYWKIEVLNMEHQVSSAFLPWLYNNGSSAQEGQRAQVYTWDVLGPPVIVPDFLTVNVYLWYSFIAFLPHTNVSLKTAPHMWRHTW